MLKYRVNIVYIVLCLVFVGIIPGEAKKHYTYSTRPNHFITMSLAGGYSSVISSRSPIAEASTISLTSLPGAATIGSIGYEMRYRRWILGLNANFDYTLSRHGISHFTQKFDGYVDDVQTTLNVWDSKNQQFTTIDYGYSPLSYVYDYYDYVESQQTLHISAHLYTGANIGHYCYGLVGVRFSSPLQTACKAKFNLSTLKVYPNTNTPESQYGNGSDISYEVSNPNGSSMLYQFLLSPSLEFGARLRIPSYSGRVGMRLGVFAEWGIPMNLNTHTMDIVDYSVIHSNIVQRDYLQDPANNVRVDVVGIEVPTKEALQNGLKVNSVLHSNLINHTGALAITQFTFGIKWTILFNVTAPRHYCVICED